MDKKDKIKDGIKRKAEILKKYVSIRKKLKRNVKIADLKAEGISKDAVQYYFNSLTTLEQVARDLHPTAFHDIAVDALYSQKAMADLRDTIDNCKRFVVTTAVVGCHVNDKAYAAVKNFCDARDAKMLVLVASDPAAAVGDTIDRRLQQEHIIFHDTALNSNIFISAIKLSAKHIDPITGLERIGQRNGTFIYASPKQRLHLVATSNEKLPHALMTTGAITDPNYDTDRYMSERTAYIAENDHVMGAIIVEVVDDNEYHYRQVQFQKDGSFIDLGVRYLANGKPVKVSPAAIIPGDWHSGETDPVVAGAIKDICKEMKPRVMVLHDAFDGLCINHHEDHAQILKAVRAQKNQLNLNQEIVGLAKDLDVLSNLVDQVVVVKSNHDEFLSAHYLQHGKYVEDPQNHRLALELAIAMMDGKDPLQYGVEKFGALKNRSKVRWLQRDEDFTIAGIQLGAHGDKGANGSKGSLRSMEKSYTNSVTGHSHTPGIIRGAWAVGTSSHLKLTYNEGPSSWLQTLCLVYPNGSRQLINVVEGKWRLE